MLLYEAGLIQIRHAATLGANGVNLSAETSELSGEQLIPRRLAMRGYCILAGEQRLWV